MKVSSSLISQDNHDLSNQLKVKIGDIISTTTQTCDGRYRIRVLVINVFSPSHLTCYAWMCERVIYVINTDCFAIALYMLEELVNTIVANAGGEVCPSFDITFNAEFCKLDWEYDIQPLTSSYRELSNHMFDWIRTWLNPQLEDVKCYVCSPYLVAVFTGYYDINSVDRYEYFIDFLHDKYYALPDLDITTFFVLYTCGKHWTLYALGPQGFFHFNSMASAGFHFDLTIRKRLTKLWAARNGYAEKSVMWQSVETPSIWIRPNVLDWNDICFDLYDWVHFGRQLKIIFYKTYKEGECKYVYFKNRSLNIKNLKVTRSWKLNRK